MFVQPCLNLWPFLLIIFVQAGSSEFAIWWKMTIIAGQSVSFITLSLQVLRKFVQTSWNAASPPQKSPVDFASMLMQEAGLHANSRHAFQKGNGIMGFPQQGKSTIGLYLCAFQMSG